MPVNPSGTGAHLPVRWGPSDFYPLHTHIIVFKKLLALLLFVSVLCGTASAQNVKKGSLTPAPEAPATSQVVKVGFYPISVYELDMGSNTYFVDMYLWLRWKGDIDPTASLEFTNMVDEWGKQQEVLQEKPKVLPDGSNYQILRIEGRFVQPFNLAQYPLDQQKLSVMVEDSMNPADVLHFEVDTENSGVGSKLQIPGWSFKGWSSQTYLHDYGSSMGEETQPLKYSTAEFSMHIGRPMSFFYWKLLMPLVIVLLAALASLLLDPDNVDARTGLPAGALLTAIFLQKSYSDGLPDLGYLVLMDQIYLVAYTLIVTTLIRAIFIFKKTGQLNTEERHQLSRADQGFMLLCLGVFALATIALVMVQTS